jgi:hypothetical protein
VGGGASDATVVAAAGAVAAVAGTVGATAEGAIGDAVRAAAGGSVGGLLEDATVVGAAFGDAVTGAAEDAIGDTAGGVNLTVLIGCGSFHATDWLDADRAEFDSTAPVEFCTGSGALRGKVLC